MRLFSHALTEGAGGALVTGMLIRVDLAMESGLSFTIAYTIVIPSRPSSTGLDDPLLF